MNHHLLGIFEDNFLYKFFNIFLLNGSMEKPEEYLRFKEREQQVLVELKERGWVEPEILEYIVYIVYSIYSVWKGDNIFH